MAKEKGSILIVDDDDAVLLSAQLFLEQYFIAVRKINNPSQITEAFKEHRFDLVLLDMNFKQGETSGEEGLKWLDEIKKISPETNVLLMTAYGEVDIAVEAMKKGAMDFIMKPWQNEKLLATVRNALKYTSQERRVKQLENRERVLVSSMGEEYREMIGQSSSLNKIKKLIDKVAATEAEVLILGENGTGKEVAARALHAKSNRSDEVFIAVDLGSIPENLFESELFGHKKGAFTDAKEDRTGRFEAASGGTLFLDEIGNLTPTLQSKLLTVLQRRQIVPVGANQPVDIDVRIISATNTNLKEAVAHQQFREDLLYRINTVELEIPPLRDRIADLPELLKHFIEKYEHKYNKGPFEIDDSVIEKLKSHHWPGNVRELQHAIERAVILSEGLSLDETDFGFLKKAGDTAFNLEDYNLENIEAWAIKKAIDKHEGNISHAAKELGLSRGAMYRRMDKYNL